MKNLIFILFLSVVSFLTAAQTVIEKNLPAQPGDKLYLDFKYANQVNINTWDKNEVRLIADVTIDGGRDDDLYEIKSSKEGNRLKISSDTDELEERWKTIYTSDDCCKRYGAKVEINIEVQMPAYLDLDFNSISGSIKVPSISGELDLNTISGDITLTPGEQLIYVKSISGDVEFLIDQPLNVDLKAKTISGEIYSNLESLYIRDKRGLRQVIGQTVSGRLNEGGQDWELETISGDIFLRRI